MILSRGPAADVAVVGGRAWAAFAASAEAAAKMAKRRMRNPRVFVAFRSYDAARRLYRSGARPPFPDHGLQRDPPFARSLHESVALRRWRFSCSRCHSRLVLQVR